MLVCFCLEIFVEVDDLCCSSILKSLHVYRDAEFINLVLPAFWFCVVVVKVIIKIVKVSIVRFIFLAVRGDGGFWRLSKQVGQNLGWCEEEWCIGCMVGCEILWRRLPSFLQIVNERFSWFAYAEAVIHVHVVGLELNLSYFLNDAVHLPWFLGEVIGVLEWSGVEWNVMSQVEDLPCHSWLVWMIKTDMPVSFHQLVCHVYTWPCSQGILYTSNVFSFRPFLTGQKEAENIFLGRMCLNSILLRQLTFDLT